MTVELFEQISDQWGVNSDEVITDTMNYKEFDFMRYQNDTWMHMKVQGLVENIDNQDFCNHNMIGIMRYDFALNFCDE